MKLKELWIWRFIVLMMGTIGVCVCVGIRYTHLFSVLFWFIRSPWWSPSGSALCQILDTVFSGLSLLLGFGWGLSQKITQCASFVSPHMACLSWMMEPTLLSFYRPTPDLATEVLPLPYHPACISQGHPVYGAVTSDLQISRVGNSVGWFLTLVVRAFWADFTLTHIIFFFLRVYFWLHRAFVCVWGLSPVVARGGYSLAVVLGLFTAVASLVAEHGL